MFWRVLLLVFGVWACSTAAIWIKSIDGDRVHWSLMGAYRLLVAAAILSPLFFRDLRRYRPRYTARHFARSLVPAVLMAVHFLTWIPGVQLTRAANASLTVNLTPAVMPFLLYAMMRERLNAGEWVGTAMAVAGVAVLAGADYHFSPQYFRGDLICFASMALFASYLALGRRNRDFPSLWLYLVPLYFVAGLICFAVSLAFTHPLTVGTVTDVACIVGLAVMPTVIGHTILNQSMKHIGGQTVSLANLSQFIFAAVMAYFLLTPPEVPDRPFYVAAGLVVAGAAIAVRYTPSPEPRTR